MAININNSTMFYQMLLKSKGNSKWHPAIGTGGARYYPHVSPMETYIDQTKPCIDSILYNRRYNFIFKRWHLLTKGGQRYRKNVQKRQRKLLFIVSIIEYKYV